MAQEQEGMYEKLCVVYAVLRLVRSSDETGQGTLEGLLKIILELMDEARGKEVRKDA